MCSDRGDPSIVPARTSVTAGLRHIAFNVRPTLNPPRLQGIRVFRIQSFPNHLVFDFVRNDSINVVRALHGSRDLDAALDA